MPNDFSCRAAARPAIPAPITITFPFLIPTNQYTMIKLYKKIPEKKLTSYWMNSFKNAKIDEAVYF